MNNPAVPFVNLRAQNDALRAELLAGINEVLDQSAFAGGVFVERFEEDFARYCGTRFAVGVGHGTDALWLALRAVGVGPGDEVITASSTFFATAEAIAACGATPVFVDIDPVTFTIDARKVEPAITPQTKVILPVHLYGQTAEMDEIVELAHRRGLFVIEDACQAHGATYKGRKAGSMGDIGCFSFYPTKNLGALGEAGAVVTSNPIFAQTIRMLRDHGQRAKYHHAVLGWNSRMDGLQAVALRVKLRRLDAYNAARRRHAAHYARLLSHAPGVILPQALPTREHVYHLYVVRIPGVRDQVASAMAAAGVMTSVHYPVPVHQQPPYQPLHHTHLPFSERLAAEYLSLPMYPELTAAQVERVADALISAVTDVHESVAV